MDDAKGLAREVRTLDQTPEGHGEMLRVVIAGLVGHNRLLWAKGLLEASCRYHPRDGEALAALGEVDFRLGDEDAARQSLARAVELEPQRQLLTQRKLFLDRITSYPEVTGVGAEFMCASRRGTTPGSRACFLLFSPRPGATWASATALSRTHRSTSFFSTTRTSRMGWRRAGCSAK